MVRNWLIVVIGLVFGLIVGVLAPSIDLNASTEEVETEQGS